MGTKYEQYLYDRKTLTVLIGSVHWVLFVETGAGLGFIYVFQQKQGIKKKRKKERKRKHYPIALILRYIANKIFF